MFNVMKEAHKHARNLIKHRPMPYRCALGAALVVCHSHAKRITKLKKAGHVPRNTHELKAGDIIRHYGCLLVLKNPKMYPDGTRTFDTYCLAREAGSPMPVHWLKREGGYTIQGNNRATWALVVE